MGIIYRDIMFLVVESLIIRADGWDDGDALVLTTALRGRICTGSCHDKHTVAVRVKVISTQRNILRA